MVIIRLYIHDGPIRIWIFMWVSRLYVTRL